MPAYQGLTRRSLLRAAAAFLRRGSVGRLLGVPPLQEVAGTMPVDTSTWQYRQYVVHATVMLGAIPIFSKQNVGGAAIALEQARSKEAAVTGLQLTAGSSPERLRGLNRYGATQEVVREEHGAIAESAYVSFMATSREKGLADARKAFTEQQGTQMFTVARGKASANGCTFGLQHLMLDAKSTWSNAIALLDRLAVRTPLPPETHVANYGPGCLSTFLFAVRRAILEGGTATGNYVHNNKVYRLRMQAKADENSALRIMTGTSISTEERGQSEFRLWLSPDDSTSLPARIEFRPKSFLKLTLDTDRLATVETLQPLLKTVQG
jgi:hypothetical protein